MGTPIFGFWAGSSLRYGSKKNDWSCVYRRRNRPSGPRPILISSKRWTEPGAGAAGLTSFFGRRTRACLPLRSSPPGERSHPRLTISSDVSNRFKPYRTVRRRDAIGSRTSDEDVSSVSSAYCRSRLRCGSRDGLNDVVHHLRDEASIVPFSHHADHRFGTRRADHEPTRSAESLARLRDSCHDGIRT